MPEGLYQAGIQSGFLSPRGNDAYAAVLRLFIIMKDEKKTKNQLIEELEMLRRENAELSEAIRTPLESSLNITRYKRVKESLEEVIGLTEQEKAKTASIIAAIGDGVSIQDRNFRILYQNQAQMEIVGGDKRGGFCYISYAHNAGVCEGCPVEASFRDGEIHRLEKSLPGNRGYIEIKSSPLFDSSGNVIAGIEVVRDITERKRIEKTLADSEKRYRMLFESAGDAIFILGAEGKNKGRIIDANKAAAEIHGYTIGELLTMKITDLDTPETAKKAPQRIKRILKGEQIKEEATHCTKNGEIVYMDIIASLIELDGHKYILAFDRDITRRKIIEQERETLINELKDALENIKKLRGLIPICAWCKKIRDDKGYWEKVEEYIQKHAHVSFTHGICPECLEKEDPELFKIIKNDPEKNHGIMKKKLT
jgi:PAS domain S-box-containing protein